MSEIQQIKDRISITELVSEYIELKRAGINYTARCPFHNEKTPSFYVSDERGTYKCFGCGEGGDIFSFVEYMDGLTFKETLKKLADKAGVTLSNDSYNPQDKEQKTTLESVMVHATDFFVKKLATSPEAKKYLENRGFTQKVIADYKIGYAPDAWNELHDYLRNLGIDESDIEKAGLIKKGEKGRYYDRFRDRIMFPLSSIQGHVVAFSGRYIGSDDVPAKYLNSPETPLFNKSKELYGIDTAKKVMRKYDFACVVEGQVDLVMAQQVFPNTVATSGTSLTAEHIKLVKRFTDRIVFVFDSDNAGVNAAFKATRIALAHDMEVKITSLPDGNDPADIIATGAGGVEKYKEYIAGSKLAFDFFTEYIAQKTSGREQTKQIEDKLLTLLSSVANPLERDRYINHIASKLSLTSDSIHEKLDSLNLKTQKTQIRKEENKVQEEGEKPQKLIERYVQLVLWYELRGNEEKDFNVDFESDLKELLETIKKRMTLDEETKFKLENEFETDILLSNEISELQPRIITRYKQHKLKSLQQGLEQAKREGRADDIQTILKNIQTLITT